MESIIKKLGKTSVTVEKDYHSSEKEYNKLTIVEEEGTFKTYLSRKPVPIGTELTNREYWIPFSGVLESITFDYLKFKKDYASGKAIEDNAIITRHILNRNIERIKIALKAISEEEIDDNAIIERTIKDRNITSNKIAQENILTEHFAKKSVITSILADYIITAIKLADNSVTTRSIVNENITDIKLANNAVTTRSIAQESIIEEKFANNSVSTRSLIDKSVTKEKLAENAVTTRSIAQESIIEEKFANNSVSTRSLIDKSVTKEKLAENAVTTRSIAQESIIEEKFANNSVSTRSLIDKSVTKEKLAENSVTESKIADNNITNRKIANNTIDITKFDSYTRNIIESVRYIPEEFASIKEAIFDEINKYKPIVINGDVINAADEEDITSENNLLKLKDRSSINGMGYAILRKNKSFAKQVTKSNTIYEIRYDFNLNGAEVTIPEGCVLDFQGGSLSNGTINGNLTIIQGNTFGIFDSIIILGEWNVRNINSNMFKTLREENSIKNVFNLSNSNVTNKIIIENNSYDYLVTNDNTINLTSNSDIEINGIIKIVPNSASSYIFFDGQDVSNINIYGCGKFIGDRDEHSYIGETTHEWGYGFQFRGNVDNIRISGLFFTDFTGGSIRFNDKTSNIKIENVTTERNRAGGIEFTGGADNIIISNCNFKDVGIDTEHSTYTKPGDSIGIEPSYHIGLDNINIENCKFVNCRLPIYITNGYEMGGSFSVRGCIMEGGLFNSFSILFGNMKFINIENCISINRNGKTLVCNDDYKKLNIKNNYIISKGGILYYYKVPTGFSIIENNQFEDEGRFSIKGLKNCNFINNSLKTNGAFAQDSQPSVMNFINNKIDGLFCYNNNNMVLNDSIITGNTFIQPTSQNAIWFSGKNIKIKNNNFITDKELEFSRACLYLTDASNIVISENLFATKINSMNYYILSSNSSNIYLLNNIFSEKKVNDRYVQGDGIIVIKDGEYRTRGSSDKRPIIPIDKYLIGKLYFDTTLNKPIWWTGSKWVDATGADVQ